MRIRFYYLKAFQQHKINNVPLYMKVTVLKLLMQTYLQH